jgi:predicted permease
MKRRRTVRRTFHLAAHAADAEREVDEEIAFHLKELTEKLMVAGWSPAAARQEALRRFGDRTGIRDECRIIARSGRRRRKMGEAVGSIVQDARQSLRGLSRQPTFTAFAVGSLALGIAANIVVFTLFYTVLFEPLPYPDGDRLLFAEETSPAWRIDRMGFSYPDLVDFQARNSTFTHLAGFLYMPHTVEGEGAPQRLMGCRVSATFLGALGVQPALGRDFRPEEEGEGAEPVVLISSALWHRRFGGDPDVIGRALSLGGHPATIIGVLPANFRFPDDADVWMPFRASRTEGRGRNSIDVVGRLRSGVSLPDAEHDLERIARDLGEVHWGRSDALGARVMPLRSWLLGDWEGPVLAFYGVVCLVLLLACANVANLLLARNSTRRKEIAVRASLGAGRGRILRQLLTEGITLTLLGGGLGVLLGLLGRDLLLGLSPVDLPNYLAFHLRPGPVLIISGIILGCGLLFSLGPAISASRARLGETLRAEGARVSSGVDRVRFRSALVALEIAMALVVLTGGGLMFKSLIRQLQVDPGFDPAGVMSLRLDIPDARYRDLASLQDLYQRLEGDVGALPGIVGVAITTDLPTGRIARDGNTFPEGADLGSSKAPIYPFSDVSPGFWETMGIPLLQGRDFSPEDGLDGSPEVVIVNELFAQRHWPNESPVGKRITRGEGPPDTEEGWATVVGVVGNTFTDGFGHPVRPAVYWPINGTLSPGVFLVARSTLDPEATFQEVRGAVEGIDPGIPVSLQRSMSRALLETNWQIRFYTWLFGIFSFLAVFMASAGVYGVISFVVASRSREFSLRMAVGALPAQVTRLVLRRAAVLSGIGLALGLIASLGAARFLSEMLFEVSPLDLPVFLLACLGMGGIVFLASYLPAQRILRINPMAGLREE